MMFCSANSASSALTVVSVRLPRQKRQHRDHGHAQRANVKTSKSCFDGPPSTGSYLIRVLVLELFRETRRSTLKPPNTQSTFFCELSEFCVDRRVRGSVDRLVSAPRPRCWSFSRQTTINAETAESAENVCLRVQRV